MRQVVILVGALLVLSISAAAQGPAGAGGGSGPRAGPRTHFNSENTQWQAAVGYQYNRINLNGTPFNTNGFNATITRYFFRWIGLEAQAGIGFGNTGVTTTPPNLSAKSVFVGGGPRLAFRAHGRIEPWAHGVAGIEHFRFSQTAGVLGSNTALAGALGGGVDFLLGPHTAFRVEADVLASRFFSLNQRHFQVVSGLVFNF